MNILCFGSLNIDHVYHVNEIVKAGMTIESAQKDINCGGKGLNQSVAMARAGVRVHHAGAVGRDGTMLTDFLKKCGVNTKHVAIVDEPTGHAIIQVDTAGENSIIIYGGANRAVTTEIIDRVLGSYKAGDFLVLQNEISGVPDLIIRAKEKGMVVIFNPSPMTPQIHQIPFEKVDYLFVNETEGQLLSGKEKPDDILKCLRERYPLCTVILTLGKDGVCCAGPEGKWSHGIFPVKTVDTTGAGDTFSGYFIACISKGLQIPEALRIASKASSICVSRLGAAVSAPRLAEVMAELEKEKDQ